MKSLSVLVGTALLTAAVSPLRAAPIVGPIAKENVEATEVDRVERVKPSIPNVEFVISKFEPGFVDELEKSWTEVHQGNSTFESVILILRTATGYQARRQKLTYEYKKCTFPWHPATLAIIHTHPNECPALPQPDDMSIADRYHVPVFTITSRGMFGYDPVTRKIQKVMDGVEWLDPRNWARTVALNQ
jgi:hypothetical protein